MTQIDRSEPTWTNQLWHARQLLREKGLKEIQRHARVSTENRHECTDCFCCACLAVTREYNKASEHERRAMRGDIRS
jgi:hypothetical protein